MERLTYRREKDGAVCSIFVLNEENFGYKVQEVAERLADYEDLGMTPEEIAELVRAKNVWTACGGRGKYIEIPRLMNLLKEYFQKNGPKIREKVTPHGRWNGGRYSARFLNSYEEQCTNCGGWSLEYDKPYCPNCGARMDGEETTNDQS